VNHKEKVRFRLREISACVMNADVAAGEKEWLTVARQAEVIIARALDVLRDTAEARVDEDYDTEEVI